MLYEVITGFCSILIGFAAGFAAARMIGLKQGKGLRTFSFTTGIYNYGFRNNFV